MEKTSEKMEDVFDMALNELRQVFKENKSVTDKTKYAVSAMGIYSRLKSQENNANSFQYRVIKDLSKDKEELRAYIKATQPEIKLVEHKKK